MEADVAPFPFDLRSFHEARWERNAYLSCTVLIVFEYFLQLDSEVEYFWKKRWSLTKVVFLWSRYFSLSNSLINTALFIQAKPSGKVLLLRYNPVLLTWLRPRCHDFFLWQAVGTTMQVLTTHIILEMRLYAMYEATRYILALFVFLTIVEAIIMSIILGVPAFKFLATNEPFIGNFICADSEPPQSHRTLFLWASIIVIESTLLLLAVVKAWQHRTAARGSSLMQQLTRDSVLYSLTILLIYITNLILWTRDRMTLNELGSPFAFVVSSILGNRLIISLRHKHYRTTPEINDSISLGPIRFARSRLARHNSQAFDPAEYVPIDSCNPRTGNPQPSAS